MRTANIALRRLAATLASEFKAWCALPVLNGAGALVLVAGLLIQGPMVALGTNNLGVKWLSLPNGCYNPYVRYDFANTVPSGDFRYRVNQGRAQWNNVGTKLAFFKSSTDTRLVIRYMQLTGEYANAIALASRNWIPVLELHHGTIDFNSGYSFYTGTSSTVPRGQFDVYSVAAHEFGHFVELGHSGDTAAPWDVMHAYLSAGEPRRSLTTHDVNSIKAQYAMRSC